MIFFFAGAPKNGSHFQFYVLEEALKQKGITYRSEGAEIFHRHERTEARKLFESLKGAPGPILCKGHWYKTRERKLLLTHPDIKIFVIWRNIYDVMISSFFFEINKIGNKHKNFDEYYFRKGGRIFLLEQLLYRHAWQNKYCFESNYEGLVDDFEYEASRLLEFAGIKDVDLIKLREEVSIGRLRQTRNDPNGEFFRDGSTNQHRGFDFSSAALQDIERQASIGVISLIETLIVEKIRLHLNRLPTVLRFPKSSI